MRSIGAKMAAAFLMSAIGIAQGFASSLAPASQTRPTPRMSEDTDKDIGPLEGTWSVTRINVEGKEIQDDEISQSTMTFLLDVLTIEDKMQKKHRYRIKFDTLSTPSAFHLQGEEPDQKEAGWMIYETEGQTLRLAFFDGLRERPAGFEPQKKLLVVELTRTAALSN